MNKRKKTKSRKYQDLPQAQRSRPAVKDDAALRSERARGEKYRHGERYRGIERAFELITKLPREIIRIRRGKDV